MSISSLNRMFLEHETLGSMIILILQEGIDHTFFNCINNKAFMFKHTLRNMCLYSTA